MPYDGYKALSSLLLLHGYFLILAINRVGWFREIITTYMYVLSCFVWLILHFIHTHQKWIINCRL